MTRVEIIAIIIRLAAVWMFVVGVTTLTLSVVSASPGTRSLTDAVLPLLLLGFSAVTWSYATGLARRLLPEPDPGEPVVSWGREDVETIALRLFGINLLAWGIVGLVYFVVLGQLQSGQEWPTRLDRAKHVSELARSAAQCVLGLILLLGKAKLKRAWSGFRNPEFKSAEPFDEADPIP